MLQLTPIVTHIAGYRFVPVEDTQATLLEIEGFSHGLGILGTVFLASEGINISIAGNLLAVLTFRQRLDQDSRFCGIKFHETYCQKIPYSKLNFKTKKELVPLGVETVHAGESEHQYLSPAKLKRWLDEGRDFNLIDMRNTFEYEIGSFATAKHLNLKKFKTLKQRQTEMSQLDKDKPMVTFCTGGIRCEKAGPYMEDQGFKQVYQLDGGIIEYLRQTGGSHWQGNCFVFDERITIDSQLRTQPMRLCLECQVSLEGQDSLFVDATDETESGKPEGELCLACQQRKQVNHGAI